MFCAGAIAAPTSQPAAAVPADWQLQDHSSAGLTFSIPPTWKAGDHTEESFYFLLPTSARMSEDKVLIEMHPAKDEVLTKVVADAKQKIKSEGSSTKLVKDAADTLAGQPAWVLLSEKTYTNTLAEAAKPAPSAKIALPKLAATNTGRKLRTYQELCVANGKLFVLTFSSDSATYEQQFTNFKKVIASCKFVDGSGAAATVAPAEQIATAADAAEPAGWVTVSQAASHFDVAVPITWKKVIDQPTQLTFQLPRMQGLPGGDQLNLSFGPCHAMTIKQMADEYRGDITKDPQQKLMQDEPTTLGGRPAWLFVAKDVHELHHGGAGSGADITKRDGMFLRVLTIDKDWQFMMTLDMDHAAVAKDLPVMKQVVEKFKWTAPPRDPALATTQPS